MGLRSIENILVGDLVWARDEEIGEEALKPVLGLIRLHDRVIWDLETVSETGESHTFGTTDDHPWWVEGHGWKRTDELSLKDILVTQTGEKVSILSVTNTNVIEPTFNFEVADFNTYFVGESKVWVHNAGANCDLTQRAANVARSKELGVPDSQIGPSGKPKVHNRQHSGRKSADQSATKTAQQNGGQARNDANPSDPRQGPHFQAEDAVGNNVQPVVHENYPKGR